MSNFGGNNNGKEFARRPQSIFNDYRYPMPTSDKPVEGAKYPARWTWELGLSGQIFFKVNDGVWGKDDRNAKSKEVELSNFDRNAILNLMQNAIDDVNFTKAQYVVKKITFGNGKLNDFPSVMATFTIIRDSEGKIHVGYTKGTYKVMFPFTSPYESTILVAQNGGEPTEAKGLMSRVFCKAFIDYSRKFLDQYEYENYKPKEKKENGGNGGGGFQRGGNGGGNSWGGGNNNNSGGGNSWGGNGGNSNGGGQQRQASVPDFAEDIDF
ncbi:hypothetical protein pETSU_012 [Edwardsiella phage pEt-SU]|uniref:Uncharacterized protein n=1 Tax=Edwardsiella phage pEt-SU TaxID=2562142 RepID=A0A4D6DW83_9CAUD|nr:hypothetical protein HOV39_gp012 [Edwardsiella phage pEt-SU]QBZ70593.1 hypothetical protein pETSU_012 [Edwardsiella phage pEt-SU]